jgi:hypothetical protein
MRSSALLFYSRDDAVVPPITGQRVFDGLTAAPDKQLVELLESAHEATLDFDLERIGLEWLFIGRAQRASPATPGGPQPTDRAPRRQD